MPDPKDPNVQFAAYLRDLESKGYTKEQIVAYLKKQGYSQQQLDAAFGELQREGGVQQAQQSTTTTTAATQESGVATQSPPGKLNMLGLVAFILSTIGLLLTAIIFSPGLNIPIAGFIPLSVFGIIPAFIGMILGIVSLIGAKKKHKKGNVFGILAIIFGALKIFISALAVLALISSIALLGVNGVRDMYSSAGDLLDDFEVNLENESTATDSICSNLGGACLEACEANQTEISTANICENGLVCCG